MRKNYSFLAGITANDFLLSNLTKRVSITLRFYGDQHVDSSNIHYLDLSQQIKPCFSYNFSVQTIFWNIDRQVLRYGLSYNHAAKLHLGGPNLKDLLKPGRFRCDKLHMPNSTWGPVFPACYSCLTPSDEQNESPLPRYRLLGPTAFKRQRPASVDRFITSNTA